MKLLHKFRETIAGMGPLKRAWFTSFNLNPSFVERYILPALAGVDAIPRTARDFEMIMHALHKQHVDVQFFCDGRMLELDEGKKTAVTIHPLNIKRFDKQFQGGVFHPKIIFLQDVNDKSVLFAGSANLTVGGWAHNRECMSINEITNQKNADAVMIFFQKIFDAIFEEDFPSDFIISTGKEQDNWTFSSTIFDGDAFFDLVLPEGTKRLAVWSPYFPSNLKLFVNQHFRNIEVHIIPDTKDKKIRLLQNENNETVRTLENIVFEKFIYSKQNKDVDERMTHAKVWITERRAAIGSWNMTGPATGTGKDDNNNIEAGIIIPVDRTIINSILVKCSRFDYEFMNEKEIEEEKPDLSSNLFNYNIRVLLDWRTRRYMIRLDEHIESKEFNLKLPDQRIEPLRSGTFELKEDKIDDLLKNHLYILEKDGEPVQTGFITEINRTLRPIWKHGSLSDIFNAYITGLPVDDPQYHRLVYQNSADEMADNEDEALIEVIPQSTVSYFGMFQAFSAIRNSIDDAIKTYDDSPDVLAGLVRAVPGSLLEIIEKVREISTGADTKHEFSQVFQWFLVHECNSIVATIQEFAKGRVNDSDINDLALCLATKRLNVPSIQLPGRHEPYLEAVKTRCGY